MTSAKAIGLIGNVCLRIFGLCILIAENQIPKGKRMAHRYIRAQRAIFKEIQDDIELEAMLEELYEEES
ncbi:MAG: hypothetical protein IJ111_01395 [Eggerthellaceae bacterium]|nr:hypothetical protein [Eggerthellaceae bacterium]